MDRARTYGRGACGGVVIVAFVPLLVAFENRDAIGPAEIPPRWLVLGLLILVPAIVGALGVRRRDGALLVAAAGACLPIGVLSVATMPILIPALLFLVAAPATGTAVRRRTWLVPVAIVGLTIGAYAGLLVNTETRCWLGFESPTGIVYRDATRAETELPIGGPGGPVAAGCHGGALTVRGAGLAAVLAIGAVALAVVAPRPIRRYPAAAGG
jgi:hypothetical protein